MFVLQVLGRRGGVGVHLTGQQGHFGYFFQHHGMVDGLGRVLTPGEGAVAVADDARHSHRVNAPAGESLDDDLAGVLLVVLVQFFFCQVTGTGHGTIEVVGVGGAVAGNVLPGLGPGHRVGAVGVDDAAQGREGLVQFQMGFRVAGGVQVSFHPVAVQIQHHQVFRRQFVVFHAGGLDDHKAALPVDARHIAPGIGHEVPAGQFHIGLVDLFAQLFQHRAPHFSFQARSARNKSCSSPSGVASLPMWTNSISIMLAQSCICSAVTS